MATINLSERRRAREQSCCSSTFPLKITSSCGRPHRLSSAVVVVHGGHGLCSRRPPPRAFAHHSRDPSLATAPTLAVGSPPLFSHRVAHRQSRARRRASSNGVERTNASDHARRTRRARLRARRRPRVLDDVPDPRTRARGRTRGPGGGDARGDAVAVAVLSGRTVRVERGDVRRYGRVPRVRLARGAETNLLDVSRGRASRRRGG